MKRVSLFMVMLMMTYLAPVSVMGSVLFQDSFDRGDDNNVDASVVGMSGPLAPMTYQENFEGSEQLSSIRIKNNKLQMAFGPGMSSMYLDHNFTDQAILDDGGFSVSMTVANINASGDDWNRWGGFGVGMSAAEAASAKDPWDNDYALRTGLPLGGNADATIVSDFFVDLSLDNRIRVWSDGALLETIQVDAHVGVISANFSVSDFNAGTLVNADIYLDGVYQTSASFDWTGTDENYIGISARANNFVALDDLSIATVPEPATMVLLGLGGLLLRRRK